MVYNVVNGDFRERIPYEPFVKEGLEGISSILATIAEGIEKHKEKIDVYGVHHSYIIGSDEDIISVPEAMRLVRTIIETGILTSFRFTYFLSQTNWLKVVKSLFRYMPYPVLYYSLMYSDEKLLHRVGQEYAYTDDEDVRKALPEMLVRMLNAIGNPDSPRIFIGLYLISSELYVALPEEVWYKTYRDNVLSFFCKEDVIRHISHSDPLFVNVKEGIRFVRSVEHRIELFKLLVSAIPYNAYWVNALIYEHLHVDRELMENGEFASILMDVIKGYPLKDTYMIASKFGRNEYVGEELRTLIDDIVKHDALDFGSETTNAICILSDVVRDETVKERMREILLNTDMWNCGITQEHFTDPQPIGLETVNKHIGWTENDWRRIAENMMVNMNLMEEHKTKIAAREHFKKEYNSLLQCMQDFVQMVNKDYHYDANSMSERVESMLTEMRDYDTVINAISKDDYNSIVDGLFFLKDKIRNEGVEACHAEISVVLNRILLQKKEALGSCLSMVEYLLINNREEMLEMFDGLMVEILKKYAVEFDYQSLSARVPYVYYWMKVIARTLEPKYEKVRIVRYWLDDPVVNRFNEFN